MHMSTGDSRITMVHGTPVRRPSERRDKAELKAMLQESVLRHTMMLRERLLPLIRAQNPGYTEQQLRDELDRRQPVIQEFDPVVEMGLLASDYSNGPELRKQLLAEIAQYTRPKLKHVEFTQGDSADSEERRELAGRLVGLLDAAAAAKRGTIVEGTARERTDPPAPPVGDEDS